MTEHREQKTEDRGQKTEDRGKVKKHNFRNLKIYQRAISFSVDVYRVSRAFPSDELYGLTSQLRRATVSISLNIAEGSGCSSEKEFRHFLTIALRSAYEVMACVEIATQLSYCGKEDAGRLTDEADELAAMITGFSKAI